MAAWSLDHVSLESPTSLASASATCGRGERLRRRPLPGRPECGSREATGLRLVSRHICRHEHGVRGDRRGRCGRSGPGGRVVAIPKRPTGDHDALRRPGRVGVRRGDRAASRWVCGGSASAGTTRHDCASSRPTIGLAAFTNARAGSWTLILSLLGTTSSSSSTTDGRLATEDHHLSPGGGAS